MGIRRTTLGAALALLLLSGCASAPSPATAPSSPTAPATRASSPAAFPVTLTDDDGVSVTVTSAPKRIVTFAPSNTEILFSLGLGDRLVGVSGSFDDYPPGAKNIEQVGGAGDFGADPNVEKVVALQPDLMLTISGGDQWKTRLRDLGIPVFTVNATDFQDLLHDIRTIGDLTGTEQRADALTMSMTAGSQEVAAAIAGEPPVSCFFEAYYPPLTTVGPHTFISDLLRLAGCDSVSARAASDYPEWSIDRLVAQSPAVYLVASESGVSAEAVARRPGFSSIAAVRDGAIHLVDSDLVSRPGPRVVDGLMELAKDLHPEAFP